jgi:hypothetical protein
MEENTARKGWFGRNWKWAVPTGCGIIIVIAVIAIVGGLFWGITGLIEENDGFKEALTRAEQNEIIVSEMGKPLKISGITTGKIRTVSGSSSLDVTVPVEGPEGKGILKVIGSENNEVWTYQKMEIYLSESKETVNLLTEN